MPKQHKMFSWHSDFPYFFLYFISSHKIHILPLLLCFFVLYKSILLLFFSLLILPLSCWRNQVICLVAFPILWILLMASLWCFSYFYPQYFLKLAVDFQITFNLGVTIGGALSLKKFPGKSQWVFVSKYNLVDRENKFWTLDILILADLRAESLEFIGSFLRWQIRLGWWPFWALIEGLRVPCNFPVDSPVPKWDNLRLRWRASNLLTASEQVVSSLLGIK